MAKKVVSVSGSFTYSANFTECIQDWFNDGDELTDEEIKRMVLDYMVEDIKAMFESDYNGSLMDEKSIIRIVTTDEDQSDTKDAEDQKSVYGSARLPEHGDYIQLLDAKGNRIRLKIIRLLIDG